MRTTMILEDRLIKELMRVTGAKTRTQAVNQAISEFLRRRKLEGLKALSGKIRIADDWQELEEVEMKAQEGRERRWHGHR